MILILILYGVKSRKKILITVFFYHCTRGFSAGSIFYNSYIINSIMIMIIVELLNFGEGKCKYS